MYFATRQQMAKLDRLAVRHGLEIRQMMELAGWHMVELFSILGIRKSEKIVVLVGRGNKGGDGLAAARHLLNHGYRVSVITLSTKRSTDSEHHLMFLKKMGVDPIGFKKRKATVLSEIKNADVIIDALIGYNLAGSPRAEFAEVINAANQSKAKIIAYDLPSGMEATTGRCHVPTIKAFATLTLALPKRAFRRKKARQMTGWIFLGDIGIPKFLYDRIARNSRPRFRAGLELVRRA